MIASEIIKQGMELGVYLYAEDGQLKYKLTKNEFPDAFKQQVLSNKADVLAYLLKHEMENDDGPVARTEQLSQYPLSPEQESFWFIGQQDKQSGQYNLPVVYELADSVDLAKIEQAFNAVIDKQVVLKTNYRNEQGKPVQFINDYTLTIEAVECPMAQLKATIAKDMLAPFDLENDQMLRVKLFSADNKRFLLVCLNHISTDNFGMSIMLSDFFSAYEALTQGKAAQLSKVDVDYFDYSQWQHQRKEDNKFEAQVTYWKDKLSDIPPVHNIPLDAKRPQVQTYTGKEFLGRLDSGKIAKIDAYCAERRITKNIFFQSLFSIFLGYSSNPEHVVFGCPVDRRQFKSLEPLVGCFTNTIINKNAYNKSLSLAQYIRSCDKTFLEDLEHADVPYNQVVSEVNPERSASYQPLHQVRFTFIGKGADETAQKLGFNIAEGDLEQSKFDFSLQVKEQQSEIHLSWLYCVDLIKEARAAAFNDIYMALVEQVLNDDSVKLADLELLGESQKAQVIGWSEGKVQDVDVINSAKVLTELAKTRGLEMALSFDAQQLSFSQLNQRVQGLAEQLQSRHADTKLFGIYAGRGINAAVAILAVMSLGKGYVPIFKDMPDHRITDIIKDAELDVVLVADSEDMNCGKFGTATLHDLNAVAPSDNAVSVEVKGEDTAYIIYTSGSTGKPKGVVVSYNNLSNFKAGFEEQLSHLQISEKDAWLWNASIAFDASLKGIVALLGGHPLVIPTEQQVISATDMLALVKKHQLPVVNFTPLFMTGFIEQLEANNIACDLVVSGDEVSHTLWRQLIDYKTKYGRQVLNAYGPTEGTVNASYGFVGQSDLPHIGGATVNTRLYVLSDEQKLLPPGIVGELYIGGQNVADGYLNLDDKTRACFIDNPFKQNEKIYRTGDFARFNVNGEIEFYGRKDNQVKYRGYRIELEDIASQVSLFEGVKESAVLLLGNDEFSKRLVAFVAADKALDENNILKAIAKDLPPYMLPTRFVFVDSIDKTIGGKVDSKALMAKYDGGKQQSQQSQGSSVESQLREIWAGLLEVDTINNDDSFFALGGHSLLAMKLLAQMKEDFNVDMDIPTLFQHITFEQQLNFIQEHGDVEIEAAVEAPAAIDAESQIRQTLGGIWQSLLSIETVEDSSDFFVLGGHSLLAMKLLSDMQENFGAALEITELFTHTTFGTQVQWLLDNAELPQAEAPAAQGAAKPAVREELAAIWCAILEIDSVEDNSDFFKLGGHSLLAMKLLSDMNSQFGHSMEITDLFSHVEFGQQVSWLEAAIGESSDSQSDVDLKGFKVASESDDEIELEL